MTSDQALELTENNLTGYFMYIDVSPIGHIQSSNPTQLYEGYFLRTGWNAVLDHRKWSNKIMHLIVKSKIMKKEGYQIQD